MVAGWRARARTCSRPPTTSWVRLNFIAEDLPFDARCSRYGFDLWFPGMDVLEFSDYDVRCGVHPTPGKILYTSTHDTSTLAGWCTRSFAGGDEPSGVELAAKLMSDALASDAPGDDAAAGCPGLGDDARMNAWRGPRATGPGRLTRLTLPPPRQNRTAPAQQP